MGNRERIIEDAKMMCEMLSDTTQLEDRLEERKAQLNETGELYRLLITQSSTSTGTTDFRNQEEKLYSEYSRLNDEVNELSDKLTAVRNRRHRLQCYIDSMHDKALVLSEWDNKMWVVMIDHCIVHRDKTVTFVFRDGTELTE